MSHPSPRAAFDHGLFLAHFNRGKEHYDQKQYPEAERELEEAYLLRPRDQKVLNLLGLVYFKQEKLEKAEEVYRKLTAESPDAHTLFYNLGLIYFKLNQLEEAESAFAKALELCKTNPKINFYLGSIYERLYRFQDAIYQYRQAGANLMVRRVEGKIAAVPGRPTSDTVPGVPRRTDETAEFRGEEAKQLREALRRRGEDASPTPAKKLGPVSPNLLAEGVARAFDTDTNRYRLDRQALAAQSGSRASDVVSFPKVQAGQPEARAGTDLRSGEAFRPLDNGLMEVDFSGKVFIKQGTIYSYSGNLTFWVKDKRPGGTPALVIITGTGRVLLRDQQREITLLRVNDEIVHVHPAHLLACEETLTPRYVGLADAGPDFEFLALEGTGMVALSVVGKPITLPVSAELPACVPVGSLISWVGDLSAQVIDDPQFYAVLQSPGGSIEKLMRMTGTGQVLVEQVP